MTSSRAAFWLVSVLAFAASALVLPGSSHAQAWVPPAGRGSLAVGYQYTHVNDHLFSVDAGEGRGNRADLGDIYGKSADFSMDYGVLPGLAASAAVAYVSSMYSGPYPESPTDDGFYHGAVQDARAGIRYMIPWRGFAITPLVSARIPIGGYSTMGHASVGKGLNDVTVGFAIARSLGSLLPRAYSELDYSYSFVEDHAEHSLDRHWVNLSGGYFITNSVNIGGSVSYVHTVDGVDWATITTEEEGMNHDAAAQERAWRVGGFVGMSLWRSLGLGISYLGTIDGENTHAGNSITIAPTWFFSTPAHW